MRFCICANTRSEAQAYHNAAAGAIKTLASRSTSLYRLATEGPGDLHKALSPLRFCAEGDEAFLPTRVSGANYGRGIANVTPIWRMFYPQETPNLRNIRPDFTTLDWAFIVGYVLSFIAILFTFDSISGELERGTLRLTLANAIPRHTVLVGKFLGAFISVNIPFAVAVLMNLILISTSDAVQLNAEAWERLGILYGIVILYTCLFITLGTSDLGSGAREWRESRRAVVNLGEFCGVYAEYLGIYWQSNVGPDRLHGILDPAYATRRCVPRSIPGINTEIHKLHRQCMYSVSMLPQKQKNTNASTRHI